MSSSDHPEVTQASQMNSPYPEQRHAGKVGYGPRYHRGPTFHDKVKGFEEELKGKFTHNPALVEQGKKRISGELQREEREKDMKASSPFDTPPQKKPDEPQGQKTDKEQHK